MIRRLKGMELYIDPNAMVAENATIVGEVTIGEEANIWYGAVLRGDGGLIRIGAQSSVEDNAVIHGNTDIGCRVIVGHSAVLHACTIEDEVLIGMGAIVMDGVVIGSGSLVAAGSLVLKGTRVPPGSLVMGSPAQVVQATSEQQRASIVKGAHKYVGLARIQLPRFSALQENAT